MKKLYNPPPKKTLSFQVDSILRQRLLDASWRKRMSLSRIPYSGKLLREANNWRRRMNIRETKPSGTDKASFPIGKQIPKIKFFL
jgi:hypothetical protein